MTCSWDVFCLRWRLDFGGERAGVFYSMEKVRWAVGKVGKVGSTHYLMIYYYFHLLLSGIVLLFLNYVTRLAFGIIILLFLMLSLMFMNCENLILIYNLCCSQTFPVG